MSNLRSTAHQRARRQDYGAPPARAPERRQDRNIEPPAGAPQPPDSAAAIALLDAQYPWLRGAEKRFSNRTPRR